jgi:hypothetical protein
LLATCEQVFFKKNMMLQERIAGHNGNEEHQNVPKKGKEYNGWCHLQLQEDHL